MCVGAFERQKRVLHRRQSLASLAAVTPTATQEDSKLLVAFKREIECMENIGSFLGNIAEVMCYQSKEHVTIADSENHMCWAGYRMGT